MNLREQLNRAKNPEQLTETGVVLVVVVIRAVRYSVSVLNLHLELVISCLYDSNDYYYYHCHYHNHCSETSCLMILLQCGILPKINLGRCHDILLLQLLVLLLTVKTWLQLVPCLTVYRQDFESILSLKFP